MSSNADDSLPISPEDVQDGKVFYGSENCFRLALLTSREKESEWRQFFERTDADGLSTFAGRDREWTKNVTKKNEPRRNAAIHGLSYATAHLLNPRSECLDKTVEHFKKLGPFSLDNLKLPEDTALQKELNAVNEMINRSQHIPLPASVDEFAARAMLHDLSVEYSSRVESHNSDNPSQVLHDSLRRIGAGECTCPVGFSNQQNSGVILRMIVRCWKSHTPVITPDLIYGGAFLPSLHRERPKHPMPGWEAILDVWRLLQPLCRGVRVSIGFEAWNRTQEQKLSNGNLTGDSIQAAVALAIWSAYGKTSMAKEESWRERIRKIDPRLLDFQLDETAIVSATLPELTKGQTLADWELGDVGAIHEKFKAAKSVGLQQGVVSRNGNDGTERSDPEKRQLERLEIPTVFADKFPDLCEKMSQANEQIRNYRVWCEEEFYREFQREE